MTSETPVWTIRLAFPSKLPEKVLKNGYFLGTARLLERMGLAGAIPVVAAGSRDDRTGKYNDCLMNAIDILQEERMKNPVCAGLRDRWSDLNARFELTGTEAAGESAMGLPVSAVAALAGYALKC